MKKNLILFVLAGIFVLFNSVWSGAQEVQLKQGAGFIESITEAQMILSEYDFDSNQEKMVDYKFSEDVDLQGVYALSDLGYGDFVEVMFELDENGKTVSAVSVPLTQDVQGEDQEEGQYSN